MKEQKWKMPERVTVWVNPHATLNEWLLSIKTLIKNYGEETILTSAQDECTLVVEKERE